VTVKDRITLPARLGSRRVLIVRIQDWPDIPGIFDRLSHMMNDTVTVEPRSGEVNGTPTYGAGASLTPCFVVNESVRYRDNQGNTLVGEGYVIAPPPAAGTACLQVIYG
jgi:hypothetical protein